ncbi:MAG TPA: type II secretion system F family protein [Nocardioides sp.]|uniref:type II secretion system F family protein n=1 Tax=Nocardioides sp. TaxID=35761 RepID=UPI002E346857|nr:type II secretion system F family protein [Nocardioides sp.]HEX3932465.1 type II secretion system F family protein [Nocardioides sp.]
MFVTGRLAVPAGAAAAAVVWVWAGRAEPASVRRRRAALARELPAFVQLLAVALESGCDVAAAIRIVSGAMPGPAARLVVAVSQRLSLGVAPAEAWRPVLEHAELAPLGRAMVRAHRSGTSVTAALGVLADELESRTRQGVEERARSVGVKAALPLGLCLLPSFLLIGIVPMTVSLLRSLSLW